MMIKTLLTVLAAAQWILFAGATLAQNTGDFPARPMRLIIGFPVGGVSDVAARAVAEQLGQQMGQRMVIDARTGAGGTLSMEIAARATPDGYTLHLGTPHVTLSPLFTDRKLPFDPLQAFAPVSLIGTGPAMLSVNAQLPVGSVQELIAYGKSRPAPLRFGHSGAGSIPHLAGELYRMMSGANLTAIPYRGAQNTILGALQGEVDFSFLPLSSALPHIQAGRLKGLAVTSAQRAKALPNVPAIAETLPGFNVFSWYGVLAPAATPKPIVAKLNAEMKKALGAPALRELLQRQGIEVEYTTQAEFAKLMREDHQRWAKLVKDAGIVLH